MTDRAVGYMPPVGDAVTVGMLVSRVYTCVAIVPLLPAESLAKYFNVVVDVIVIGDEYTVLEVVGLLPLVV